MPGPTRLIAVAQCPQERERRRSPARVADDRQTTPAASLGGWLPRGDASLVRVGRDDLAAGDGPEAPPSGAVDAVLDEADRPVAHQHVDPAGVVAPGVDGREGRAPL